MKIEIRMEDGAPILFFPDVISHEKMIVCFTRAGEHSSASRAYMRSLRKPSKREEIADCFRLLATYANNMRL